MVYSTSAEVCTRRTLSVLALSSRFDGVAYAAYLTFRDVFQYSLCRVVLMVGRWLIWPASSITFQYSLCRVVLMVNG